MQGVPVEEEQEEAATDSRGSGRCRVSSSAAVGPRERVSVGAWDVRCGSAGGTYGGSAVAEGGGMSMGFIHVRESGGRGPL